MKWTRIDLSGQTFGRLHIIRFAGVNRENRAMWEAKCSCGRLKIAGGWLLRAGKVKSCGCLTVATHGKCGTRTYQCWNNMKMRVLNQNNRSYKFYSPRGISICARWINSFENFLEDMGECPPSLELDRINNDGNYEPSNCRWATDKVQANNRRPRPFGMKYKKSGKCSAS